MRRTAIASVVVSLLLPAAAFGASGPQPGMKLDDYVKADVAHAEALAGKRFDQIDTAKKGVVDRASYIKYYEERSQRLAKARFDRIDTDHNGVLEESELAAWKAAHARGPRNASR
jgi:hypothetical protein